MFLVSNTELCKSHVWFNNRSKTMKNTTIDVTFGGVFDYVGLKDMSFFKPYHDKGALKVRLYAVREK